MLVCGSVFRVFGSFNLRFVFLNDLVDKWFDELIINGFMNGVFVFVKDIDLGLEFLEVLRILLCINIELFDVLVLGWWWWLLEFFKFIWFFMLFLMLVGVNCIWCGEVLFLVFFGLIIGWLKNDFWSFIFGKFFVNWGV